VTNVFIDPERGSDAPRIYTLGTFTAEELLGFTPTFGYACNHTLGAYSNRPLKRLMLPNVSSIMTLRHAHDAIVEGKTYDDYPDWHHDNISPDSVLRLMAVWANKWGTEVRWPGGQMQAGDNELIVFDNNRCQHRAPMGCDVFTTYRDARWFIRVAGIREVPEGARVLL
jgi:hypothetical protein